MDQKPKYYNEKRNKASQRYNTAHMELITCRAYKRERINDLISAAVAKRYAKSKAEYILGAIRARLDADGITADDLPPLDDK